MKLTGLVVVLAIASGVAPASGQTAAAPARAIRTLNVPKTTHPPEIDGLIDDWAWRYAASATTFRVSGTAEAIGETTEVLVLADAGTLYVAFLCRDSQPDRLQARERRRNRSLELDDHVVIEIDPDRTGRTLLRFAVNRRGTTSDATGDEASTDRRKGRWKAEAHATAYGWIAELAIPFDALGYGSVDRTLGVDFIRFHARTAQRSRWTDIDPRGAVNGGRLAGLPAPRVRSGERVADAAAPARPDRVDPAPPRVEAKRRPVSGERTAPAPLMPTIPPPPPPPLPESVARLVPAPIASPAMPPEPPQPPAPIAAAGEPPAPEAREMLSLVPPMPPLPSLPSWPPTVKPEPAPPAMESPMLPPPAPAPVPAMPAAAPVVPPLPGAFPPVPPRLP